MSKSKKVSKERGRPSPEKKVQSRKKVTTKVTSPSRAKTLSPVEKILDLLKKKTNVELPLYKLTTMQRRVERRMMLQKIADLKSYYAYLQKNPEALKDLYQDIFVHVTEFFRNPESWDAVKKEILPGLMKKRDTDKLFRVWVAGCSTGEEAYTWAMLLDEFIHAKKLDVKFQIFASDVSEAAIKEARKGFYSDARLEGVPDKYRKNYFEKSSDGYRIIKEVRDQIVFSCHDLTSHPPFAHMDVISCRNVLIYFDGELQDKVMPIFHYSLTKEGYLWLGNSEGMGRNSASYFSTIDKKHKLFQKKEKSAKSVLQLAMKQFAGKPGSQPDFGQVSDEVASTVDRVILGRFSPSGVVVNEDYDILQFRGKTTSYLEPSKGTPANLLRMIRPEYLSAVKTLFKAIKSNRTFCTDVVSVANKNQKKKVTLCLFTLPIQAREKIYFLSFENSESQGLPKARFKTASTDVDQLRKELEEERQHQQSIVEQFESAQEELTSANEELQATNEELQSTNEEMETAREELQVANEELTSMNEELQTRNKELSDLNESLARSEERFRLIVESVRDYAIFMLDPEGKVASWNEGARRFKGYEPFEIIGKSFSLFYSKEDIDNKKPEWELEMARTYGRVEDEGWRVRKDGTRFWANVVITCMRDRSGHILGFSKVTRDLTEKRVAEEKLRQSEERLRLMVSAVKDYAIFMLDPQGMIVSWNEGARRIKGYSAEEIIGSSFKRFYTPEDLARNHPDDELRIAIATGKFEEEGWRVKKDGSRFWANVLITRLDDEHGRHLGFVKVTRDLTERRKTEEELKKAYHGLEEKVRERTKDLEMALSVRDEFLSIASHELKTPLTSLKLQLQLGQRKMTMPTVKPEELNRSLDICIKQVNSLGNLVDDLLEVSRIQSGWFSLNLETFNLGELVEEIISRFSQQLAVASCTVELRLDHSLEGSWDRQRLEQVIVNLISNAIKYAPRSPLVIETKMVNGEVVLKVRDFGPGISKEKQGKIFDRFERVNTDKNISGLGLGLFISKRIIESHQGQIEVESELGHGTEFTVRLPLSSQAQQKL
jgi:PAS domain S-box-containing protein